MKEAKSRAQSKIGDRAPGELRVVAINCNPAPDSQDRLRRLFTILLEHAARSDWPLRRRARSPTPRPLKTMPGRKPDALPSNPDRHQPGRRRPVLRHGAHGQQGRVRPRPGLRRLCRHALGAAQHLRASRMAARSTQIPLHVVDNGRSLREDVKALTNHSGSQNYVDIPVYLKGRDGEGDGIGRRQCTDNYKIGPIRKKIRDLLGLKPRQRVPSGVTVELWLGISTDEAIRMKTSRDRWITNRYPLVEAAMSRQDCIDWWAARYDRPLERSACVACPFPVTPALGGDEAQVAGPVRRGCADRRQPAGLQSGSGLRQGALPTLPQAAPCPGGQPRRGGGGSRRAEGRLRQRVRGTLWRLRSPEERRRERHHPAGLPMTPTPSISVSGSWSVSGGSSTDA